MMRITKENYGLFVIDYLDGNLSAKDQKALLHFLEEHPELKEKINQLRQAHLQAPAINFPDKEKLKKPEIIPTSGIDESNYEEFLLLSLDQELSTKETESFSFFMENNPQLKTEQETFSKTRLEPDTSIVYSSKAKLKKNINIAPALWISSIAAAVLVLLGWIFFFNNNGDNITKQYQRHTLVIVEIQPQSVALKNNVAAPELLPVPKPKKQIFRNHQQTNSYLRNPVLIAQLSPRGNQHNLVSSEQPQIIAIQNTAINNRDIMAKTNHQKKKPHVLLAMLEGGVKAVNFLTKKDMLLVKTYNRQGQLVHYQVLGDDFNFDKQIRNKK